MNEPIKQWIHDWSTTNCIPAYGYASAEPFVGLDGVYQKKLADGHLCEFERRVDPMSFLHPTLLMEEAKSFYVMLLPHGPEVHQQEKGLVHIASGNTSLDYHLTLKDTLTRLSDLLAERFGVHSKVIVDTTPLSDRAIALRAGLGIIRRNNMFYHPRFGSYVHIGSLLMDVELPTTNHVNPTDPCGQCTRCVHHCPGKAILGDGTINSHLCLSYLTQKKVLNEEESVLIDHQLYGCDVCQQVCPANRGLTQKALEPIVKSSYPIKDILQMSNQSFKESFGKTASGWRGKRTIQRNALAALGNENNPDHIQLLEPFLKDERPIIREEALKSITRLKQRGI